MEKLLALPGGQPLKSDDWALIQETTRKAVEALVQGLSGTTDPCIIVGLEVSYPDDKIHIAEGVMYDGQELCYVPEAEFTVQGELPDNQNSVGWRLMFVLNETDSEMREFKNSEMKQVYRSRQYQVDYNDTLLENALELPPRMMDMLAGYVAPLVTIPTSVEKYVKRGFDAATLEQYQEIIPAPGSGKAIQIISLSGQINPSSQLDVEDQTLQVFFGTDPGDVLIGEFPTVFLEQASQGLTLLETSTMMDINQPVCLCFSSLNQPKNGSAFIYIHCIYKIITL